jgi:membrane protease YdiL (CAAX protease family)
MCRLSDRARESVTWPLNLTMELTPRILAFARARRAGVDWLAIVAYVSATIAVSWAAWILMHRMQVPLSIANALAMLGPTVGVLVVAGRRGIRTQVDEIVESLNFSRVLEVLGAAYVLVPALLGAGAVIAVSTLHQNWTAGASLSRVVEALTVGMLLALVGASAEEVGWRGYLFGALRSIGAGKAAIGIGVVWGIWHIPAVVLYGYNYHDATFWGIIAMTAFTVPFSVILCWARTRGASVLPAIVIHGSFNAMVGVVALGVTNIDPLLAAPLGLAGILPMGAFAAWLLVSGQLTAPEPATGRLVPQAESA